MKKLLSIILAILMIVTSVPFAFAAESDTDGTTIVITMTDSFGDGWSDNAIQVGFISEGVFTKIADATIVDGSTATYEITISDDKVYAFRWTKGYYPDECSFTISVDGEIIFEKSDCSDFADNELIYIDCNHNYTDSVCSICGLTCGVDFSHKMNGGTECTACGFVCNHNYVNHYCMSCGYVEDGYYAGACGADDVNDAIWSLDSEGTLTISGEGEYDVPYLNAPWKAYGENIKNVVIEEGITNIEEGSFLDLPNTVTLSIPSTVTSIYVTYNNSFVEFKLADGNNYYSIVDGVLFNYDKTKLIMYPAKKAGETSYTVPDGVTTLGHTSFREDKNLKTVNISDDVTTIESYCFCGASIENINFGKNVENIYIYAFDSSKVKSVVLPEKLTEIPYGLFYGCGLLENLVIGSKVTSIDELVIQYCNKLKVVHFTGTEEQWQAITKPDNSEDKINTVAVHFGALEEKDATEAACGEAGHTAGLYCSECDAYITGEEIPATGEHTYVDSKCEDCGYECDHEGQTGAECEICGSALHVCDFSGEWQYDSENHWKNCSCGVSDTKSAHTFIDGVCECGYVCSHNYTNHYCKICGNVEDGYYAGICGAEKADDAIWSLDSEGTLTISGEGEYDVPYLNAPWRAYGENIKNVVIEEGITNIKPGSFYALPNAVSLSIPSTVTTIECLSNNSFAEFKVADGNNYYSVIDGVLFNYDKTELIMYPAKKADETYTVPDGVTNLGRGAFNLAENLKTLNICDDVTTIKDSCFSHAHSLENINFGENVEVVEKSAFYDTGLKTVVLPEKLTEIPYGVFWSCAKLETLVIGSNVTSIDESVIMYCDKLKTVHFTGTEEQWQAITKPDNSEDAINTIEVHFGALEEKDGIEATCGEAGHTSGLYCDECNAYLTGEEIPADADAHDWSNLDGICANGCGLECDHKYYNQERIRPVQNADGTWSKGAVKAICRTCGCVFAEKEAERDHEGYAAFEEAVAELEALLNREDLVDGPKNDYTSALNNLKNVAYSLVYMDDEETMMRIKAIADSYISEVEAGLADGTMKKADWTYMTELFEEINAIINNDYHNIISSMNGYYLGPQGYYNGCSNIPTFTQASYNGNIHFEKQLETLLAGLKDGSALKADYTEIDEAIAEIEQKLADENVTDEAKADLEEIKSQLEEMKADGNTSEADLAELEKALEDYETELDAGIEDGSAVKVDGFTVYNERGREWLLKFADEGIFEKARELILNSTEVKAKMDEIYDFALSLEGNVAENAENIAKIEADVDEFFGQLKKCVYGIHNVSQYKEISPAKCGENAIESATCTLCGETVTREVENSALTHSFTKYEVTEEAKCGVEGKKVAACDNGCGATDEKAIEALKHDIVIDEAVTPKCGETGLTQGEHCTRCDYKIEQEAVPALEHKDADGDYKCDNGCGHEFEKPAPEDPTPDTPDEPTDDACDHLCHKGGFIGFIWKIVKFFSKLFKLNPVCECGAAHY